MKIVATVPGGMKSKQEGEAIEAARAAGFDLNLLDINLALMPEERLRQHDEALEVMLELHAAHLAHEAELHAVAPGSG